MYQLTSGPAVKRLTDGASIPADPDNTDYADYLAWLAKGNTPTPADVPAPPTKAERIERLLASKGVSRLLVQLTIQVLEDKAKAQAPSYAMTEAQGLAYLYQQNKSYRECKDMEAAILAIEAAP
jgi:hypothetical protein